MISEAVNQQPVQKILFGAAFYPEYVGQDRLNEDLDLMEAAHFSVMRVGESVWSTWEPHDGEFDLDWLQPVLDGAHRRNIGVILGTPTYAIPPWLQRKHPELAADEATGTPRHWGGRQEVDYSNPLFRTYAERVIRAILGRYAQHPSVIGYQVDNEPGIILFHNPATFAGFLGYLKRSYGTTEALNREWGLVYWSHRINDWSELWAPDGNTLPQYDLAWRRYQASITTDFIGWQADLVREYSSADQFVTTCIAYSRPAMHDQQLTERLDVTAGNPYYRMQDGLDLTMDLPPMQEWTTAGVPGLYRAADRMYSSRQERFLVTETNSGNIGASDQNYPPYPGQLRQAALALVSRGAQMVEYWHWHSLEYGTETFWGGVLPHSRVPGRIYAEVTELGGYLDALSPSLTDFTPDSDVAILYSNESKWAFEFFPPFHAADRRPDPRSYTQIFDAFYRGIMDSGAQARIVHPAQFDAQGAAQFAAAHPVLIVPALFVADDDTLDGLVAYAEAGGHLIVGMRTGYGDREARVRVEVAPAHLSSAAGVYYEEFSNLDEELPLVADGDFPLSAEARATRWIDGIIATGARRLLSYDHPQHGRFAALTTAPTGAGSISYLGTIPNRALAADVVRWAVPDIIAHGWLAEASVGVTVTSGRNAHGQRLWFIHNWSAEIGRVVVPQEGSFVDPVAERAVEPGSRLALDPYSALVLIESHSFI